MGDRGRSRSPLRAAMPAATRYMPAAPMVGGVGKMPTPQFNPPAAFVGGKAGFSGVRPTNIMVPMVGGKGFNAGLGMNFGGMQGKGPSGPVDPLDAYMASVERELERTAKRDKKGRREKIGDVASAREAFGPRALEMLQCGGKGGENGTDALIEDRILR
eukprot:TRINITY_DN75383_c0_g1_i1.p1 TRINITY_DN75383_c0_g1~~TRINITY_DN75383_c0_g1_i1.p1  ORF type:complete len:159 (-),score=29.93 TRINITY_DN75383_c0_g1_i1:101-577(-)